MATEEVRDRVSLLPQLECTENTKAECTLVGGDFSGFSSPFKSSRVCGLEVRGCILISDA